MKAAEFDQFADEYHDMHKKNIAITGESPEFFSDYKVQVLRNFVDKSGLHAEGILDFGSGIGNSIPFFRKYFPVSRLTCADVSQKSLDIGRARFAGFGQDLLIGEDDIMAEDGCFDVAFSACVFHHIPHLEHIHWLHELRRVVRPGGIAAIFEHNPLNPLTVRAVRTCPFDANARLIHARQLARSCLEAGWGEAAIRYHIFFPHALAALRPLERRLAAVPFGAQYSVFAQ